MRYVPTVNDDSLKNGLSISAGMHVVLFLLLYFGLPHLMPPLPEHHDPVSFEIVTIADMTNTRMKEEQQKPQPPAPTPPPQPKPAPTPPAPPKEEPKPIPAPPPPPEIKAEALKPKVEDKPKPVEKPVPKEDDFAKLVNKLAQQKPVEQVKAPETKADVKAAAPPASTQHLNTAQTMTIQDAIRRKIEAIWNPPIGARDAQSLIVDITFDINPDHTIANAEIVDKARYNTDTFYRAAADAAIRAVRSPQFTLNDLPLTPDTYDDWKHVTLTFDMRDML